jgi:hypothetical protein
MTQMAEQLLQIHSQSRSVRALKLEARFLSRDITSLDGKLDQQLLVLVQLS